MIRLLRDRVLVVGCLVTLVIGTDVSLGQLRVETWNVSNYSSGRVYEFQTAIYGEYMGRSARPDILIGQEFLSQSGVNNFVSLLNSAPGSPGDWAAAPFVNGPDTDNAFFYRTSRVVLINSEVIAQGGSSPNHPRNVNRYDIRPVGYNSDSTVIACYSSHMKAGSDSSDQARRLLEAQRIRDDAQSLPAGYLFLLGGDFNIQSSSQGAYQELTGSQANNAGRFVDPIKTPGSWNNNSSYRIVHTQDPSGGGGMDDRHDQILLCTKLVDSQALDYVGNANIPYSTTTWNDPNHSYRSWGNDGTSYNTSLRISGNSMVGPTIAQALVDSAAGGGHLPVLLDLRLPALLASDSELDFGSVQQNQIATATLTVSHDGDVALWSEDGLEDLEYELEAGAGFSAPGSTFTIAAGAVPLSHQITMDTSETGPVSGILTIYSNSPDEPIRTVTLTGDVLPVAGDLTGDGVVDLDDFAEAAECMTGPEQGPYLAGCEGVDFDDDDDVDLEDMAVLAELIADMP